MQKPNAYTRAAEWRLTVGDPEMVNTRNDTRLSHICFSNALCSAN